MAKPKRPWLKRFLLVGLILIGVAAASYWYIATEKFADTKEKWMSLPPRMHP